MGRVWADDANGPRARAQAESISAGLYGSAVPGFAGPGRALGPRHTDVPLVRDPADYPGSEAIDNTLRGDQPVVTRPPKTHIDRPLPPTSAEVPWEKYSPHQPGFTLRRDQAGSAQVLPPPRGDLSVSDLIGRQFFESGEPSAAPGPLCAHCFQPMRPGPAGLVKKYCSADCRKRAWNAKKQAAAVAVAV